LEKGNRTQQVALTPDGAVERADSFAVRCGRKQLRTGRPLLRQKGVQKWPGAENPNSDRDTLAHLRRRHDIRACPDEIVEETRARVFHGNIRSEAKLASLFTHCALLGRVPRFVPADAAFYFVRNEAAAKAKGVRQKPRMQTRAKKRWFRDSQKWLT
jgi:hypothetical protein